jgi:hypothetical protein
MAHRHDVTELLDVSLGGSGSTNTAKINNKTETIQKAECLTSSQRLNQNYHDKKTYRAVEVNSTNLKTLHTV